MFVSMQSNTMYDTGECDGTIQNVFSLLFRHAKRISFYKPFDETTRDSFYLRLVDGLTSKDCIAEELCIRDVFDGVDETGSTKMEKKIDYHTNVQSLVHALEGNVSLTRLDLSSSFFGDRDAVNLLGAGILGSKNLASLNLSECKFDVGGSSKVMKNLFDAFKAHPRLEILYFTSLRFTGLRLETISSIMWTKVSQIIRYSKSLTHIDLADTNIPIEMLIGEALGENRTLTSLVLSKNQLSDDEASVLALGLRLNSKLEWLDLRNNYLSDRSVRSLVSAVTANKASRLRELLLEKNAIGEQGCQLLLQELKKGGSSRLESVQINCRCKPMEVASFYLATNRCGRRLFDTTDDGPAQKKRKVTVPTKTGGKTGKSQGPKAISTVPLSLWPSVLGRIRNQHYYQSRSWQKGQRWSTEMQASVVYYMLREGLIIGQDGKQTLQNT